MKCNSEKMTIGLLYIERNSIDESPVYQRESAVWSLDKKQLFIDSLLETYDIPKFYFHDIRDTGSVKKFSIVDGKQRLSTIFSFMDDEFKISLKDPSTEFLYSELSTYQKELFKATNLDVVMIQNADEDDIEELFSRLNNGEPLNAAEKRNAIGGEMNSFIREIANHDFFKDYLPFVNKRYNYFELAIRLIQIEHYSLNGNGIPNSPKKELDRLVKNNKILDPSLKKKLETSLSNKLNILKKTFSKKDTLLKKQSVIPLYYIFISEISTKYTSPNIYSDIHNFLESFQLLRNINNDKPEDERDPSLVEYGRLSSQGTNSSTNTQQRLSLLTRYLLHESPHLVIKDAQRNFSEEERFVIWILADKKCQRCHKKINLDEMDADHKDPWSGGGSTTLSNAQCLCMSCNRSKGASKLKLG